jgi:large subunit ribosomal protein L3
MTEENKIEENKKMPENSAEEKKSEELETEKTEASEEVKAGKESAVEQISVEGEAQMEKAEDLKEVEDDKKESNDDSGSLKLPFILGTKLGMTQIFSDNGTVYPATVIQAGPCNITQIKTIEKDGYSALQIGYLDSKESKQNKPSLGHFKKSNSKPKKYLKEFRYSDFEGVELGDEISLNQFSIGDILQVTGYSKGRGFAGHMKRHNFSGGRASHGKNSVMRKAGSVGAGTSPGRVWKGTRMAGRMGNDKVTVKNLEIVKMDSENNLLFVSGSIPGPNNNVLYISKVNYES